MCKDKDKCLVHLYFKHVPDMLLFGHSHLTAFLVVISQAGALSQQQSLDIIYTDMSRDSSAPYSITMEEPFHTIFFDVENTLNQSYM